MEQLVVNNTCHLTYSIFLEIYVFMDRWIWYYVSVNTSANKLSSQVSNIASCEQIWRTECEWTLGIRWYFNPNFIPKHSEFNIKNWYLCYVKFVIIIQYFGNNLQIIHQKDDIIYRFISLQSNFPDYWSIKTHSIYLVYNIIIIIISCTFRRRKLLAGKYSRGRDTVRRVNENKSSMEKGKC